MHIIIVGCGKIGYTIAKDLSSEDHDITIIDKKLDAFDKIVESIDVMFIKGNGLSTRVLEEAEVKRADLVISVTGGDETNILCCITAKKLGAKRVIARVRDPEYAMDLNRSLTELGLDMIINPEYEAALEISRLLRFPTADDLVSFASGKVELVAFKVTKGDFFDGESLSNVFRKNKFSIVLAMVQRDDSPIIPHGDLVLLDGDTVSVLGRASMITAFFKSIGKSTQKVKDTMIIGGGKITQYLAASLDRHNIKVKIIEIDEKKCEIISETLPKALIIWGDGTDENVLHSENLEESSAIVCLTNSDEENIVIGLNAMQIKVPKIIVKVNHINTNIARRLGLGSVISPRTLSADQIIRFVRSLNIDTDKSIKTMYKIFDNDTDVVEALEFIASPRFNGLDVPLKDLKIKPGILIGCIIRRGDITAPSGLSHIEVHDTVIVIVKNENISELNDILAPGGTQA